MHRVAQSYLGTLWIALNKNSSSEQLVLLRRLHLPDDTPEDARGAIANAGHDAIALRHEHVLPVLEVMNEGDVLAVAYEHVEAEPLRSLQSWANLRCLSFPVGISLRIVADVLRGVASLHQSITSSSTSPVFGGLSPDSVLVSREGITLVCDPLVASCAALLEGVGFNTAKLAYAAPEQVHAVTALTPQADLYTCAAMLWELLATRRLLAGSRQAIERKLLEHSLPSLNANLRGDMRVSAELVDLVERGLAADPGKRFGSAMEMADQLGQCGYELASRDEVAQFVGKLSGQRFDRRTAALRSKSLPQLDAPLEWPIEVPQKSGALRRGARPAGPPHAPGVAGSAPATAKSEGNSPVAGNAPRGVKNDVVTAVGIAAAPVVPMPGPSRKTMPLGVSPRERTPSGEARAPVTMATSPGSAPQDLRPPPVEPQPPKSEVRVTTGAASAPISSEPQPTPARPNNAAAWNSLATSLSTSAKPPAPLRAGRTMNGLGAPTHPALAQTQPFVMTPSPFAARVEPTPASPGTPAMPSTTRAKPPPFAAPLGATKPGLFPVPPSLAPAMPSAAGPDLDEGDLPYVDLGDVELPPPVSNGASIAQRAAPAVPESIPAEALPSSREDAWMPFSHSARALGSSPPNSSAKVPVFPGSPPAAPMSRRDPVASERRARRRARRPWILGGVAVAVSLATAVGVGLAVRFTKSTPTAEPVSESPVATAPAPAPAETPPAAVVHANPPAPVPAAPNPPTVAPAAPTPTPDVRAVSPNTTFDSPTLDDSQLIEVFSLERRTDVPSCPDRLGAKAASYTGNNPQQSGAQLRAARKEMMRGKSDSAHLFLCGATAHDPKNAAAQQALAELILQLGDAAGAKASIDLALQQAPNDPQLLVVLGDSLALLGDLPGARLTWLSTLPEKGADEERTRRLANSYRLMGDRALKAQSFAQARSAYRRALIMTEGSFAASIGLSDALLWLNHEKAALVWAERAARAFPKDSRVQVLLGDAWHENGEPDKARAAWKAALAAQPNNGAAARRLAKGKP